MAQTDPPAKVASNDQLGLLPFTRYDHPEPHTMVWSEMELQAIRSYAGRCVTAEREKWRELAQRVAHQGNTRGLEGLKVRCTISEAGSVVSWEVDRTGPSRCDGCGKTIAEHDRLLRCCGPNVEANRL